MDDLFRAIREYVPLNGEDEVLLSGFFKPQQIKAGEYLVRAGEVCRYVAFVREGLLRYYVLDDGLEHTYDFSPEQTFACNYESFLTQTPSTRFIQALEPTTLWRISHNDLGQLYRKLEHGERFGRLVAERLFVDALQKITSFYSESAEGRYSRFLQLFPGLVERIPQYVIASYVGVKPQSLSRIRAQRAGKRY